MNTSATSVLEATGNLSDLGEWAVRYAEMDWPVFPLRPRQKTPSIPSAHPRGESCRGECGRVGHGLWDATTDADRIRRWWMKHPLDNIGLRTGDAFDVLDLDGGKVGPDGQPVDPLMSLQDAGLVEPLLWIAEEQHLLVARTANGWHLYVAPSGAGNRASFVPGCDWRGHGGYVVAPPSIHPSGAEYQWQHWDGGEIPTLPAAPAELVAMVRGEERQQANRARMALALCGLSGDSTTPYGRKALDNACADIRAAVQGERNHTLNARAFSIFQLVAGREITESDAIEALTAAAQDLGLRDREIEATLGSARNGGMAEPRVAPPLPNRKER